MTLDSNCNRAGQAAAVNGKSKAAASFADTLNRFKGISLKGQDSVNEGES